MPHGQLQAQWGAGGVAKATFLAAIWLIADSSQVAPCTPLSTPCQPCGKHSIWQCDLNRASFMQIKFRCSNISASEMESARATTTATACCMQLLRNLPQRAVNKINCDAAKTAAKWNEIISVKDAKGCDRKQQQHCGSNSYSCHCCQCLPLLQQWVEN